MKKGYLVIACMFAIGLAGCITPLTPNGGNPDRGTIPTLEPTKPPSLTNEWIEVDQVIDGVYGLDRQKMVIEANGKVTVYALARPFGSFTH